MEKPNKNNQEHNVAKRDRSDTPPISSLVGQVDATPPRRSSSSVMSTPHAFTHANMTAGKVPAFVAEPNKAYMLDQIPPDADFKLGLIRARCTDISVKEKTANKYAIPFWIVEIIVTDTVSRMITIMYHNVSEIPVLPKAGDFVQISGVQPKVAEYDARKYGGVQFTATRDIALKSFSISPTDSRIPASWSASTIFVAKEAPTLSIDEFMGGLPSK